jgi:hypothetical protein
MMEPTRRGFLKGLGILIGAVAAEPVAEILIPERKIWVVGAKLQSVPRPGQILVAPGARTVEWGRPIISEYLNTKEGREKLAASMIQPLRARLDYSSIGRRIFLVDQLPEGVLPVYQYRRGS